MAIGKTLLVIALSLPCLRAECAEFKPLPEEKFRENREILASLTPLFLGLADGYISDYIWATMGCSTNKHRRGFSEELLKYTLDTCDGDFLVLLNKVIKKEQPYGSFGEFFYEVNKYLTEYCPKIGKVFSFTSKKKPHDELNLMDDMKMPRQTRSDFFQAFLDKMGGTSEEYSRFCTTNKCEKAADVLFRLYQFLSGTLGNDSALFYPLLDFVMTHKVQAEAAIPFLMRTLLGVRGQKELPQFIDIPVANLSDKKDYPQRVFGASMTYNEFRKQTGKGLDEYQVYLDSCLNRGSAHVYPDCKVFYLSGYEPGEGKTAEAYQEIIIKEDLKLCSCDITEKQKVALEVLRIIIRDLEESMAPDNLSSFLYDPNKSLVDNRCAYVKFLQQPDQFTTLLRCVSGLWNDLGPEIQSDVRKVIDPDAITDEDCRQYDCVWNEFPRSPLEQRLAVLMSRWIQRNLHFLDSSDPRPVDALTVSKYSLYTPIGDGHGEWMSSVVKAIARRDLEHLERVYDDRLRHLPSELDIPFWRLLQAATANQLSSAMRTLMSQSCFAQYGWIDAQAISCLDQTNQPLLKEVKNILKRKKIPQSHGAAFFLNNILTVCEPNTVRETLLSLIKGVIDSTDLDRTLLLGDAQLYQDATDFVRFARIIWVIEKCLNVNENEADLGFDNVGNGWNPYGCQFWSDAVYEPKVADWRQQRNNFLIYDHATHTYPHLFTVFPFYYDFMPEMPQNSPEGESAQPNS